MTNRAQNASQTLQDGSGRDGAKPLHVQVAEALGCQPEQVGGVWRCACERGDRLNFWPHGWGDTNLVARYDKDWSATGPLLARHGIGVSPGFRDARPHASTCITACGEWCAMPDQNEARIKRTGIGYMGDRDYIACADGETELEAVCNLILALKAAGKLPQDGA